MPAAVRFGILLGALAAGLSLAGNLWRSDPHLLSVFGSMLEPVVVFAAVFVATRRRRLAGWHPAQVVRFGRAAGATAGLVFAVAFAVFARWWFPRGTLAFHLFGPALAFAMTTAAAVGGARLSGLRAPKPA